MTKCLKGAKYVKNQRKSYFHSLKRVFQLNLIFVFANETFLNSLITERCLRVLKNGQANDNNYKGFK